LAYSSILEGNVLADSKRVGIKREKAIEGHKATYTSSVNVHLRSKIDASASIHPSIWKFIQDVSKKK
jgi:hypothetical protein